MIRTYDHVYFIHVDQAFVQKYHGILPKIGQDTKGVLYRVSHEENGTDLIEINQQFSVEYFFSREKLCIGAGLIMTKLTEITLAFIALSVYVSNLSATPIGKLFAIFDGLQRRAWPKETRHLPCHFILTA